LSLKLVVAAGTEGANARSRKPGRLSPFPQ